jgi:ATP-binding cassette, subfamily B, bacterial
LSQSSNVLEYDLKNAALPNRNRGIWRFLSGYRLKYLGAISSQGIAALAKTATYFLLRYFVDNYFTQGDKTIGLQWIAAGFIGLAAVEGSFTFLSGRLAAQTGESVTRRLRNYLFDHVQRLTFSYHDQMKTGELIERCTSDVDAVRRFISEQIVSIGRIFLLFVINFVALLELNSYLGLISVVVVPLIVIVSALFFKRISNAYEAYQEQEAILSTTLQENLSGVRVVKAFARQQFEIAKFEKDNWKKYLRGKKLVTMHSIFWPISDTLCNFQILVGYFIGATMAINGTITLGTYLAYAGMIAWIIFPMRNLGRLIVQSSTGLVSFDRVMTIIRENREPIEIGDYQPEQPVNGQISFDNVGFQYEAGSEVLTDISFNCQAGQVVALLGSTGSGKTTLVNLLPRFYEYSRGSILLDGVELNRFPRSYLRQHIGIVEQEPFLFSRTISENITYGVEREVSQGEIESAARAAAIHDTILTFDHGYKTLVGEKGVTLSGGQKQRIAIARTLLKDPRILIMDDSTSSVDTETEAEIRRALQNLMKNRTTFIIAHRIQSVMDADLILVMDKGKIVQRGVHDDLLTQQGIYRQIYNIQTRIEVELEKEIASAG